MTPEERARSLLLPTSDETEGVVPRGRSESQDQGDDGQGDTASVPSTVEYPENNSADLVILDDSSWCFMSDISKLVSNTSSFFFVVSVDGIKDLFDEETSPFAFSVLSSMTAEEPHENISEVYDEILQASLARTVASSATEFPVYRVSGSKTSSAIPKANNRARNEVAQLEQRQYRQQFLESKYERTHFMG